MVRVLKRFARLLPAPIVGFSASRSLATPKQREQKPVQTPRLLFIANGSRRLYRSRDHTPLPELNQSPQEAASSIWHYRITEKIGNTHKLYGLTFVDSCLPELGVVPMGIYYPHLRDVVLSWQLRHLSLKQ